jgi:uncharacterized protein YeaO (DUF488 family)
MLITCSVKDVSYYEQLADIRYFIVLYPGRTKLKGFLHAPELAPSPDLLSWALEHNREENWFSIYTERFNEEMKNRPGLRDAINRLEVKAREKVVLIVCFCPDANCCHRSLIADELQQRGIVVEIH